MTGPALVYLLCFLTCALCTGLLIRTWIKRRTRLLLWTATSFVLLAINNLFLLADTTLLPDVDLGIYRSLSALAAVSVLIFGLIWEAE